MQHRLTLSRGAIAAALPLLLAGCNVHISTQAEARDTWQRHFALAKDGTLEIRNANGLIDIQSTEGDGVDVTADRVVRAVSDEAAKDALSKWEIDQSATSDRIVIDSGRHGGMNLMVNMSRRADYHVRAPQWANLRIETTNGTIDLRGPRVAGSVRLQTTNGNVKAIGLENSSSVTTTNGAVTLEVSRLGDDGVSCETTNGSITLVVPTEVNARLSARVTNGGISARVPKMTISEESRRRLDATLGSGGPTIRLETTNGAVTVAAKGS